MKDIYLTYNQLSILGVSNLLIRQWRFQERVTFLEVGGVEYVGYMSIPQETRNILDFSQVQKLYYYNQFHKTEYLYESIMIHAYNAYNDISTAYLEVYKEMGYSIPEAVKYARQHSVWAYFIETLYKEYGVINPLK